MQYVYKVMCEWDIGLDNVVFASPEGAWEAAQEATQSILSDMDESFEELKDNGLVYVEIWDICE